MSPVFGNIQNSKLKVKQLFSSLNQLKTWDSYYLVIFIANKMFIGLGLNCLKIKRRPSLRW